MPEGSEERFHGWGVMGLPFDSGHVLALRRFPASSVGPGYTAVWHRASDGRWTMYVSVAPRFACPRYFGRAVSRVVETEIVISWSGPRSFRVVTGDAGFHWDVSVVATPATRLLNAVAGAVPEGLWRSPSALGVMARLAGSLLEVGTLRLHGRVPNGHRFRGSPRRLWLVDRSSAMVGGRGIGAPGPLDRQARLGDFWIPQRGLLAFGDSVFNPPDAAVHRGPPPARSNGPGSGGSSAGAGSRGAPSGPTSSPPSGTGPGSRR